MTAESRPDHGPTQVRSIKELKVGNLYIHHAYYDGAIAYFGSKGWFMKMIQLLSLPAQSETGKGIYSPISSIMCVQTFSEWRFDKPMSVRNISLPEIGLAEYPGNPGKWDPARWLEDPLKMEGGHLDITQTEALKIIRTRMNPGKHWSLRSFLHWG